MNFPELQPYGMCLSNITVYELDKTLEIPNKKFLYFLGGLMRSKIIWTGPKNQPMFIIQGGFGHSFSNLMIDGQGCSTIFLQKYVHGSGAGKHSWTNCHFENAPIAIQQGENLNDSNCDLARINNCHFENCGSALKVVNNQSVDNSIRDCRFIRCNTVFDLEAGSCRVDGAVIHSCKTVLHMKNQGQGNSRIDLRGLHIDNPQQDGFKLINHENPNRKYLITIDGLLGPQLANLPNLSNVKFDYSKLMNWKQTVGEKDESNMVL